MITTKKQANEIVGGLSEPSKMPGYSWSISPEKCHRGTILKTKEGSVCSNCYACKGRYVFPNTKKAQERRLQNLRNEKWVEAMSFLLKDEEYFRWFDSGDLQNVNHLIKIVDVCNNTPNTKHLIFTREFHIVLKYLDLGMKIPENLCIRISADYKNKKPMVFVDECGFSTVSTIDNNYENCHKCPTTYVEDLKSCKQANCFSCWNKEIKHIDFKKH